MNGFLNINKPAGMSSAAVVGAIKRLTGVKRVGHAGTLDPMAAGVLPIMVGRATRLFDYLVDKRKEYVAVCAFGAATDTQDATGQILETGTDYPTPERIREKIPELTGDIRQKPSMYSAIKVGGQRLYALARKGETVDVPERTVHVESIEILGEEPDHGLRIRVACGKGTYIRSLCADLGKLCGCPAHMRSLVRTRSGVFTLAEALTLEEARALAAEGRLGERLISPDAPIGHLLRMDVPERLAKQVAAGAALPLAFMTAQNAKKTEKPEKPEKPEIPPIPEKPEIPDEGDATRIYLRGAFWGIAERKEDRLVWRAQIPPEEKA